MITQNALIDLSFIISLIRSDIKESENIVVLQKVLETMENSFIENNQFRDALQQVPGLSEKWEFCKYKNYYVRTLIFNNQEIQTMLENSLKKLKLLLELKKFEQAYDLADALHVLPEIIADNKGCIQKTFYKIYAKQYVRKWKSPI